MISTVFSNPEGAAMKLQGTTCASMRDVMVTLLGGLSPLPIRLEGGTEIQIKAAIQRDQPITIVDSSPNSERKVRIPVKVINLNTHGVAEFNFAVKDRDFDTPHGGIKITIE